MAGKATTTVSTQTSIAKASDVTRELNQRRATFAALLPPHLEVDRFIEAVKNVWAKVPEIRKCEPQSFISSVKEAAYLGLEPDGLLGQGWIIPFGEGQGQNKRYLAKFIPGYRGLMQLGYRTGEITSWKANVVHQRDRWKYTEVPPHLEHEPSDEPDPGPVIAAYSYIQFKDGTHDFEWMWLRDLERIRKSSRMSDGPAYRNWPEEMQKKAPVRRHAKRTRISTKLQRAADLDERHEAGLDLDEDILPDDAEWTNIEKLEAPKEKPQFKTVGELKEHLEEKLPDVGVTITQPEEEPFPEEEPDATALLIDQFRQSIPDTEDIAKVMEYVGICAKDNQMGDDEFMANVASEAMEPFWKNYRIWANPVPKESKKEPEKKKAFDPKEAWKTKTSDGVPLVYCVTRKRGILPSVCPGCSDQCAEFMEYQKVFAKK